VRQSTKDDTCQLRPTVGLYGAMIRIYIHFTYNRTSEHTHVYVAKHILKKKKTKLKYN